ncbi:MAG: ABC transporter ATP-binding protein/permease [Firmicutes bacterium]|jgi:ATP-binding cassette subfamily B protein|nr:ABC transporter ATP-binding protein/permease [Bacillota bacterium]MCL5066627.1 ABC transporter ATP-binding protein/permease [Bacillota bacterium]
MGMGMGMGGGGMRSVWSQQRSLSQLKDGQIPDVRKTMKRVWLGLLRPYRKNLLIGTGLVAIGVIIGLVPPLLLRRLIDQAIPQGNLTEVVILALGMLLFPVAGSFASIGQNYVNTVIAQRVMADLRHQLYSHGQRLGLDFFTWSRAGEIHSRFINDIGALQQVLNGTFTGIIASVFTITFTFATMLVIDWKLALICAVALPSFAFPVLHFGRRRYQATQETQQELSRMTILLEETLTLSGSIVVKSFGTQQYENERFKAANESVRRAQIHQTLVGQWLSVVVQALSTLGPALLYGYGGYLAVTHQIKVGTIVAFAAYLGQLYSPASNLAGINTTVLGGLALFDRIFQFLDVPVAVPLPDPGLDIPALVPGQPVIRFEGVEFAYNDNAHVLHGVDFSVQSGHLVALVGPSGAGKTTILSLMARFYDPTEGRVYLHGEDLRHLNNDAFRKLTGLVTQELFLFHASLYDNITYGTPAIEAAAVDRAVQAAQLAELVDRLPEGMDTVVGERGYRLSGGEKQRVAIARAILHNPEILLLDEATSSLDSHSEHLIQDALGHLFQGRTVVAIAHRLSTILAADQILVVDQGRVVARGRHQELLAEGGLYRVLYEEQFGSQAKEEDSVPSL